MRGAFLRINRPARRNEVRGILLHPSANAILIRGDWPKAIRKPRRTNPHGTPSRRLVRPPPAPAATQPTRPGESGPPPAAGDLAAVRSAALPAVLGSCILGLAVPVLGRMEGRPGDRHPGHRGRLASPGVPAVLAVEVAGPAGAAAHRRGAAPAHPPHEPGEPPLGRTRIQAELRLLGHDVAKSTVAKYLARRTRPPSPTWRSFLANHTASLASIDFFVVPTIGCGKSFGSAYAERRVQLRS